MGLLKGRLGVTFVAVLILGVVAAVVVLLCERRFRGARLLVPIERPLPTPAPRSHAFARRQVVLHDEPRIVAIEHFLPAADCKELIERAQHRFAKSTVVSGDGSGRTSSSAYLARAGTPVIKRLEELAAQLCSVPSSHVEPLQVVRYRVGERYDAHHDFFDTKTLACFGGVQRLATFFVYLNTLPVDAAGATTFPDLGVAVRPEEGKAVWWYNVLEDGTPDFRTLHCGSAPHGSNTVVKYGLNIWVRQAPYVAAS